MRRKMKTTNRRSRAASYVQKALQLRGFLDSLFFLHLVILMLLYYCVCMPNAARAALKMKLRTKIFIPVNLLLLVIVGSLVYLLIDLDHAKIELGRAIASSAGQTEIVALVNSLIDRLTMLALTAIFVAILLTIALYYYLRAIVTKPIVRLSDAAVRISDGDFQANLKVRSRDEIGDLGRIFNQMATKLGQFYRDLEDEVVQKTGQLALHEELEKRKDDFIGMASHELKTPITSLKLFSNIVSDLFKEKKFSEMPRYLERMDRQIARLTDLVGDLLDVARIQAGRLDHQKEVFEINKLIEETIENIEPTLKRHEIVWETVLKRKVFADKHRIGQVLVNLIANAVKYSPKADKIVISMENSGDRVVVSVKDFGIGIASEHRDKIFDRFYRVHDIMDRTFPGLGMGLYISSEILKKNDGEIWVESEPGKGSKFSFSLPTMDDRH